MYVSASLYCVTGGFISHDTAPHCQSCYRYTNYDFQIQEKGLADLAPFKSNFYSDVPVDKHEYWASLMVEIPIEWYTQPVTYTTWKDIPTSWIYTTLDQIVTYEVQQRMVQVGEEAFGIKIKTYILEAGHSPFLSMPDKLADLSKDIYERCQFES